MTKYEILYNLIRDTKPHSIIEIGTWDGNNAKEMIKTSLSVLPDHEEVFYYGFDLFSKAPEYEFPKDAPTCDEVIDNIKSVTGNFRLVEGNTRETLPKFFLVNPAVDFIFIDGGHSNETIASDWRNLLPFVGKDTVVVFDDYYRNRLDVGARATVDALDPKEFKVELLGDVDIYEDETYGRREVQMAKVTRL